MEKSGPGILEKSKATVVACTTTSKFNKDEVLEYDSDIDEFKFHEDLKETQPSPQSREQSRNKNLLHKFNKLRTSAEDYVERVSSKIDVS